MKIEKLCYFLSVAKHQNFTKAAKECHIAQPAISKQMLSLEKELTDAGKEFYDSISCLVAEYNASIQRVREMTERE